MNGNIQLSRLLWLLTIVPLIVVPITETNKHILVGTMRIVDFVDLTILAPFFLVVLLLIQATVFEKMENKFFYWLSMFLVGMFMYGHAMHLTANTINTYSTEIQDYKAIIPADTYQLIYFFDENLGHWILYTSLFALLGLWTLNSNISSTLWSPMIAGILFGLSYAIVFVESSQPWMGPAYTPYLVICNYLRWRSNNKNPQFKWSDMSIFTLSASAAILLGQIVYFLVVGGFVQPSELGY